MRQPDDRLYRGSRASKFMGGFSFVLLLLGLGVLFGGQWLTAIACVTGSTAAAFVAYKLAGGRENPQLYADLDLFGLVSHALRAGNARIGFHSLRTQDGIVSALEAAGFPLSSRHRRREIARLVVKDRRAFDACRDLMVIQTIHAGRECFWDGNRNPKTAEWFNRAEMIVDVQSRSEALVERLFQLAKQERPPGTELSGRG